METIKVPNGAVNLAESKAVCPECGRQIPVEEIEEKFMNQDKHSIKMKCKCNRFIGITQNIRVDFVAYKL